MTHTSGLSGSSIGEAWPREITLDRQSRLLTILFDSGECFELPAEFLRVFSPSAEVQGHTAAERQVIGGKLHVNFSAVEEVGSYAIRIVFDDGHDSGLFSWSYLHHLGKNHPSLWSNYLVELVALGLSRDAKMSRDTKKG